jgi:tetratricopeptide (TPR) repeat protein
MKMRDLPPQKLVILAVGLSLGLLTGAQAAEKIHLKDGRVTLAQGVTLSGESVMAKVELQPGQVGEIGIPLDQIDRVDFPVPPEIKEASDRLSEGKSIEAVAFADAAMKAQNANKKIPGSPWPEAALLKTQGLMLQNKVDDAKKLAAEVESTATDPETKRGAEVHLAAIDALGGKNTQAVEVYKKVMKDSADERVLSTTAIFKGQAHLELKQWDDALLAFLQIPVLYPEQKQLMPKALFGAGKAYVNLLDSDRAKAAFTELTTKFASSTEAEQAKVELKRIEDLEKSKQAPAG